MCNEKCVCLQSAEQLHDVDIGSEECRQSGPTLRECSGQTAGESLWDQEGTEAWNTTATAADTLISVTTAATGNPANGPMCVWVIVFLTGTNAFFFNSLNWWCIQLVSE